MEIRLSGIAKCLVWESACDELHGKYLALWIDRHQNETGNENALDKYSEEELIIIRRIAAELTRAKIKRADTG